MPDITKEQAAKAIADLLSAADIDRSIRQAWALMYPAEPLPIDSNSIDFINEIADGTQ